MLVMFPVLLLQVSSLQCFVDVDWMTGGTQTQCYSSSAVHRNPRKNSGVLAGPQRHFHKQDDGCGAGTLHATRSCSFDWSIRELRRYQ